MGDVQGAGSGRPRRIYILGGEASGKTTLARIFGERLGLPVHQLDSIAWQGVTGPDRPAFDPRFQPADDLVPRPLGQRLALVAEIAAADSWVAEGKHIGWTAELLSAAEVVVWLDHVPFLTATLRILRRAARSHRRTTSRLPGTRRRIRLRDYAGRLNQLYLQLRSLRAYYRSPASDVAAQDDPTVVTRAGTRAFLDAYGAKVRHVRSATDLRDVLDHL